MVAPLVWISCVASLALASSPPTAFQADEPEAQAAVLLERAETQARDGHYSEARALYKKLADRYPATPAGQVGLRRSGSNAFLGWRDLVRNGPSSNRVDVVLMGDGYTLEHMKAFDKLAEDVPAFFEHQKTFHEYFKYFNFLAADVLSADEGVDGFGRSYDTALGARTLGTFSGHVGIDRSKVLAMLAELPENDALSIVFVKQGVLGTGPRGIAVVGGMSAPTTIHEWGHAFAGLGDEYATVQSKHAGPVRNGINVSNTDDPEQVPWAHWIAAKHPSIGVYEGAGARERGAWKPTASGCVMENGEFFCPVCQEAIVLRIYSIVDPIESCTPPAPPPGVREPIVLRDEPIEIEVRVMQPSSHALEVSWWVIPESQLPETHGGDGDRGPAAARTGTGAAPGTTAAGTTPATSTGTTTATPANSPAELAKKAPGFGDRRDRGPLRPVPGKPVASTRFDADGVHTLRLSSVDWKPGRYKIVCRAKDTTELRDEKWPWVLKDDRGLLESERVWWLRVPERR